MDPLFSIVIVNWNTKELVLQCLQSVYKNTTEKCFDVWVVDNGSTDDSVAALQTQYPDVNLVEAGQNLGFAHGNNLALEKIAGKYAVLLNTDTVVKPFAIDFLITFMEDHPEAGAAGPYLLNPDDSLQISCYPFPTLFREFWRLFHFDLIVPIGVYPMKSWKTDCYYKVDSIQGACMILRKTALNQIGFFDPNYFMYTEEIDLCYRIKHAGWNLFWVPESKVVHYGGQSTRKMASQMFISLYKTKVQFFRKHHGKFAAFLYKVILFFASVTRLLFCPLAWIQAGPSRDRNQYLAGRYVELIAALRKL
jgi:N-acetylglucosaminyl-diphospho-decaprenol L-rhamnosyltransferase